LELISYYQGLNGQLVYTVIMMSYNELYFEILVMGFFFFGGGGDCLESKMANTVEFDKCYVSTGNIHNSSQNSWENLNLNCKRIMDTGGSMS